MTPTISRRPTELPPGGGYARLGQHCIDLLRLAVPVVVSRTGLLLMWLVDVIMVGQFATDELAYLGIGHALMSVVLVTGIALQQGTLVTTANALGRGEAGACGAVFWRSIPYGIALGLIASTAALWGGPTLGLFGQPAEIVAGGGRVITILSLSMVPLMVFTACAYFMEGLRRPLPGMVAVLAANLLNILLNWTLVYGRLGFPALGAEGSAWATTAVRSFLAMAMLIYVLSQADAASLGLRSWPGWRWRQWARQRRIGYGGGGSQAIEGAAFMAMSMFAGWMGKAPLAAYTIVISVVAIVFMVAVGIASATAVCVGTAHGRRDTQDLALAGWTGLALNTLIMLVFGAGLLLFPEGVARIYTSDPALVPVVASLLVLAAFVLIADGGQTVMAHALRGRGDAFMPTACHVVSYLGVMIPMGWFLAIGLGHGVAGLLSGILIASLVSVGLLTLRFHLLSLGDRRVAAAE